MLRMRKNKAPLMLGARLHKKCDFTHCMYTAKNKNYKCRNGRFSNWRFSLTPVNCISVGKSHFASITHRRLPRGFIFSLISCAAGCSLHKGLAHLNCSQSFRHPHEDFSLSPLRLLLLLLAALTKDFAFYCRHFSRSMCAKSRGATPSCPITQTRNANTTITSH
jgi:hypothetical protein